jgi:hypothetical protein
MLWLWVGGQTSSGHAQDPSLPRVLTPPCSPAHLTTPKRTPLANAPPPPRPALPTPDTAGLQAHLGNAARAGHAAAALLARQAGGAELELLQRDGARSLAAGPVQHDAVKAALGLDHHLLRRVGVRVPAEGREESGAGQQGWYAGAPP